MSTSFSGSLPLLSTLFVFYYGILTLWQIKYACIVGPKLSGPGDLLLFKLSINFSNSSRSMLSQAIRWRWITEIHEIHLLS